jgi:hypothetical protein
VTKDVLDREGIGTGFSEPSSGCMTKIVESEVLDLASAGVKPILLDFGR